jgi:hypothetical protein
MLFVRPSRARGRLQLNFRDELRSILHSQPDYAATLSSRLERLSRREFPCLGYGTVELPTDSQWRRDVLHDVTWPNAYFPSVDYIAAAQHCDVKVPWELSRLQYSLWLGEAHAAATSPEERRDLSGRFSSLLREWFASNPVGFGPNWVSAMEIAIRAINCALALALVWDDLAVPERLAARRVLWWHRAFLTLFPEQSDKNGNHFLINLLGRLALSALVDSDHQFRRTLRVFADETGRQFDQDGAHIERAPCYHGLCMRAVALALALASRRLGSPPRELVDLYSRALAFARHVASPRGYLSLFGDNDSGTVLHFLDDPRDLSEELGVGPVSHNSPTARAAFMRALAGSGASSNTPHTYCDDRQLRSSYCRIEAGPITVLQRAGEQGLFGRAAHDHDDNQSVIAWLDGEEFISERGTSTYTLSATERLLDIISSSHNVTEPSDQPRYRGVPGSVFVTMRGAPVARVSELGVASATTTLEVANETANLVVGRSLRIAENEQGWALSIEDTVRSATTEELTTRFHLAPGCIIQLAEEDPCRAKIRTPEGRDIEVSVAASVRPVVRIDLAQYLHHPAYGASIAGQVMSVSWTSEGARENSLRWEFIARGPRLELAS